MASETQILSREMAHAYLSGTTISNRLFSPAYQRIMTLIMQNKANFRKSQVNVSLYNTTNYEEKSDWTPGENKPNSKPNKANFCTIGSVYCL